MATTNATRNATRKFRNAVTTVATYHTDVMSAFNDCADVAGRFDYYVDFDNAIERDCADNTVSFSYPVLNNDNDIVTWLHCAYYTMCSGRIELTAYCG